MTEFVRIWTETAKEINDNAVAKGFWDEERNDAEMICLMHAELSEALEGLRHGNPPSDHIPEFTALEEELADAVIRIMDMAYARKCRLPEAIQEKMKFNASRPYKHGKKF